MANWAIVVGINEYWNPAANLRGAVPDAVNMAKWLMAQDGGNVPPRNLHLLTRPIFSAADAPHRQNKLSDAKKGDLIDAVDQLMTKSGGKGDRLFFYFAGHGLINRQNFTDEQALVMADFSATRTDNAVSLDTVREYFQATEFAEQFFFVDACRNVLDWDREFRIGDFPLVLAPDETRPTPSQFLLFATSPRFRAVELNEGGAFTTTLLEGLRGKGSAKIYDKTDDEYQVRVERLFDYVKTEFLKKKIVVTKPEIKPPIYQSPRSSVVEKGDEEPILARFDFEEVAPERLEIYVEPANVWAQAEIVITSEDGEYNERIRPVQNVPLALPRDARPMSYTVRAAAPDHEPEKRRWSFDLYEPVRLDIKLKPAMRGGIEVSVPADAEPPTDDAPATGNFELNDDAPVTRDLDFADETTAAGDFDLAGEMPAMSDFDLDSPFAGWKKSSAPPVTRDLDLKPKVSRLTVKSADPLAPLEITDNAGRFIAAGRGELSVGNLAAGFYRAKLVTPEGRTSEEVIELSDGEDETLALAAPPPPETALFKTIVDQTDFDVSADNTLHVSEMVGSMATAQLTTMMMLTGSIIDDQLDWGQRTLKLGLKSFGEATGGAPCGIRVVFADDSFAAAELPPIELKIWKQSGKPASKVFRPEPSRLITGLAQFARGAAPGAYILSLKLADRDAAHFSVAVLPARMTLLTVYQRADGGVRLFTFSPSLQPFKQSPEENASNLRRLELLQRLHLNGQIDEKFAYQNALDLLHAKFIDPFAGCLGGYTMLRLDKAVELEIAVKNMLRFYGELSDSHILAAEYFARVERSDDKAEQSYRAALKLGIPVFAEGLQRLIYGIEKFKIESANVARVREAFENRAPNTLLTVWTPRAG